MIIGVLLWIKALNQAEINKLTITEKIIMTKSQFYYIVSRSDTFGVASRKFMLPRVAHCTKGC